jgi:hypothetical protein
MPRRSKYVKLLSTGWILSHDWQSRLPRLCRSWQLQQVFSCCWKDAGCWWCVPPLPSSLLLSCSCASVLWVRCAAPAGGPGQGAEDEEAPRCDAARSVRHGRNSMQGLAPVAARCSAAPDAAEHRAACAACTSASAKARMMRCVVRCLMLYDSLSLAAKKRPFLSNLASC